MCELFTADFWWNNLTRRQLALCGILLIVYERVWPCIYGQKMLCVVRQANAVQLVRLLPCVLKVVGSTLCLNWDLPLRGRFVCVYDD